MNKETIIHLYASEGFQELRTKRPNIITKGAPIALTSQEIPEVWGAVSQELWGKTKYM